MNRIAAAENPGVKRLGQLIRDLRISRGETQKQLGAILGYTHSAFSDIERGKTNLTVKDLAVIANHFGISMVKLIEQAYGPTITPEPELNVEALSRLRRDLDHRLNWAKANDVSQGELISTIVQIVVPLIQQVSDQKVKGFATEMEQYSINLRDLNDSYIPMTILRKTLGDYLSHKEASK